jgi:hypothetical protein
LLPKFDYYIDESDPDIPVLRRQDRAFAAAFSAQGSRGMVSWRPPGRTTGGCSRRMLSPWLFEKKATDRSAALRAARMFT